MSKTLTRAEEQIMQALWSLGEGGYLKDIVEAMPEPKPHHNTVATLLKILVEKEMVGIKTPMRYNFYYPLLQKDVYTSGSIAGITKGYFKGSYKEVVSFLVDKKKISVEDLELLIKQLKKKNK
jgi:predicted transcriptional regulator